MVLTLGGNGVMRIFKVKAFARWARSQRITDKALRVAVTEMRDGLIEANLGGGVYKKRIAASGRGKSGGARTIVAFKTDSHTFFLFGFLKNEQENIDKKELKALKQFARSLFELRDEQIERLINNGDLSEVK